MKKLSQTLSIILTVLLVAGQLPAEPSANLQLHLLDSDASAVAGSTSVKGFTVQVADDAGNSVADAAVVFRLPEAAASGAFADGTHAAVAYTDQTGRAHVSGIQWSSSTGTIGIKITATKGTAHAGILVEETLTAATVSTPAIATPPPPVVIAKTEEPAESTPAPRPSISVRQPGALDASDSVPPARSAAATGAPGVSVTNGFTGAKIHSGSSKTKWIILAIAVAAGAGAGMAMAGKGKASSSPAPSTGVTIGGPSVSVGAP